MFSSGRNKDRDLAIPSEVKQDANSREVLRAWVANGGLVCSLRPETWDEPCAWGIVLADVARHVANATQDLKGTTAAATLERIRATFNSELAEPTDEPTGHFEEPR